MARPRLKWLIPSCLALILSVFSTEARAQKDIEPIHNVAKVSGLHTGAISPMPTNLPGGRKTLEKVMASRFKSAAINNAASAAPDAGGLRYPGDLQYNGGPTMDYTTFNSIFVNPTSSCAPNSCWGDPIGFLKNLGSSQMIHLTDQYVGDHSSHRYTVGTNYALTGYPPSAGAGQPFTDQDLALVAYGLASDTGGFGLNHIYHLFLVPGQDVCFDSTFSVCYSPDNLNSFAFCAYHGYVYDTNGNYAYYSVEPYQNVVGCNVRPDTPNGPVVDATNNVLSHETFETITDPQITAWYNVFNLDLGGAEIGDECEFVLYTPTTAYFDPSLVRLNGKPYAIQPEYSNVQHACSTGLDD